LPLPRTVHSEIARLSPARMYSSFSQRISGICRKRSVSALRIAVLPLSVRPTDSGPRARQKTPSSAKQSTILSTSRLLNAAEIARRVVTLFREIRPPERADYNLTSHEMRLLKLLVEGHNYKTAAAELRVSFNTVCFHIKRIYEKMQVHSKSEAVVKALRNRLIS